MKPSLGILILLAVPCLAPSFAFGADGDIEFSCVAKRIDQKTTDQKTTDQKTSDKKTTQSGTSESSITVDTEDWEYVVTLANNTFKDMQNLEVKYIVFSKREELGTLAGVRVEKQTGTAKIDNLKAHDKADFDTDPVKLRKASLKPGYYYPNGAKPSGTASLSGLWIRIYQNGNLIGEMSRPPELATKEKWAE